MLNRKNYIEQITHLLTNFKSYIVSINKLKLYDDNNKAEDFFKDLLKFYDNDFAGLENANESNPNAEYIDLISKDEKLAIQVTSRTDTTKIHNTIKGFLENYPELERIIILLIGESKPDYPKTDFTQGGKYKFNKNTDIIDIDDIIKKFNSFDAEKLEQILKFLEKELGYNPLFSATQEANRDILAEIFDYIDENFEPNRSKEYENSKDLTHIRKKIPLNFSKEQEPVINERFKKYFKYESLIREFIEEEQGNQFKLDGLLDKIQTEYCELQGLNDPNEKIKNIFIFNEIAKKLTPKKNVEYVFNAKLIVLYFFERCDIGKKTDDEPNNEQMSLFN